MSKILEFIGNEFNLATSEANIIFNNKASYTYYLKIPSRNCLMGGGVYPSLATIAKLQVIKTKNKSYLSAYLTDKKTGTSHKLYKADFAHYNGKRFLKDLGFESNNEFGFQELLVAIAKELQLKVYYIFRD